MKTLIFAVFVALITVQLSAQDISIMQQGNTEPTRFYVSLVGKAATLNSDWGLFGGVRVGYNFNKNFSLGLVAQGLIPEQLGKSYINRDSRDDLHIGYVGPEAAYRHNLSEKFYLTGTIMMGLGRVDYETWNSNDYFFITEPGIAINYSITKWFGLGYAVNYRLASGVKYADFSNASFSGLSTDLALIFNF